MLRKLLPILTIIIIAVTFMMLNQPEHADTYLFTVPKVLKAGNVNYIGYTLLNGSKPAVAKVKVRIGDREEVLTLSGCGKFELRAPEKEGKYRLEITAGDFKGVAEVKVVKDSIVFVETDKPIYKPGQTVHIRLIAVDSTLKKAEDDVTVEISDAKGVKVFKKKVHVDGMAQLSFNLSKELNEGVWKIRVLRNGRTIDQLDFRVEEYTLPKFEINVTTRDWVLPNESVKGSIEAKYTFGKPVRGEFKVEAFRYVGRWEKFAERRGKIDGKVEFEIPPVKFVVSSPRQQAGGLLLNVTVFEENTSYSQTVTKLVRVVPSKIDVKLIPEGSSFKPGIPFKLLVITRTQDGKPTDSEVRLKIEKISKDKIDSDEMKVRTKGGKALIELKPEDWVETLAIEALVDGKMVSFVTVGRAMSKSFYIHVEKVRGEKVGDEFVFHVYHPSGKRVYYEVVSKGIILFADYTEGDEIRFRATPEMAPKSEIVVYSFSGSEVVADRLSFEVQPSYEPLKVEVDRKEVRPRESVTIRFDADRVGVSIVDRSVFVLAENRLNLEEVFRRLEKLYGEPKIEIHSPYYYRTFGSYDMFEESGLVVLTNKEMTKGEEGRYHQPKPWWMIGIAPMAAPKAAREEAVPVSTPPKLAEVKMVRQFFPETWFFGFAGRTLKLKAPDTITTWAIHAVTLDDGLRIGSGKIRVFQPFFIKADFPYSVVRGDKAKLKVVIYNYLNESQDVLITVEEMKDGKWVKIAEGWVRVDGIAEFPFEFQAKEVGEVKFKITARCEDFADAIIKALRVVPEGVTREIAENHIIGDGDSFDVMTKLNVSAVPDSERFYLAISGSYMAQTISGLEKLIRMPFGCGEQNMIIMAPGVYVAKYLIATGEMNPELMAKAEMMITTGYQRELTFMRSDGSFSAFGDRDEEGSTFLTAFVVRTFAEAKDIVYIDDNVIDRAVSWLLSHKRNDGSFESVGFIHHRDMMGGVKGRYAMTAYVTIALLEAGYNASDSIKYLEKNFDNATNYSKALACYALALAGKDYTDKLPIENGHISTGNEVTDVEATAYALLAMVKMRKDGDLLASWLVRHRNPSGGFYSTQDTVTAIKALTEYCIAKRHDVDLKIRVEWDDHIEIVNVNGENADVTQIVELPAGKLVHVSAKGKGKAIVQFVERFNVIPKRAVSPIELNVTYDTKEIESKGLRVIVHFESKVPVEIAVIDVAVPSGFVPDERTLREVKCKRFEIADRKVIFYFERQKADFEFYAKPLFVISSKAPLVSVAYSYYDPDVRAEVVKRVMV